MNLLVKYHTKTATTDVISSQPITCLSDQQADHVTHRTTCASKYSSRGLSQQLSNLQIRRAIKRNTFINGGNLQPAEFNTKDSWKIVFSNWLQSVPTSTGYTALYTSTTGCRVYRPVPATQHCTLASTTGLQCVPTGSCYTALYTCFNNWLQSVLTGTCYTALYTCFNNWLQSVPTSTGYTALYSCFSNLLQSVPTSTGYTALYTCFNNWLQSVPTSTGYTALYVCFSNWLHMVSTYWLPSLLTGC